MRARRRRKPLKEDEGQRHDAFVKDVMHFVQQKPGGLHLPEVSDTLVEASLNQLVSHLGCEGSFQTRRDLAQVGDLTPDIIFIHKSDSSLTIVEATTKSQMSRRSLSNDLRTKLREDESKLGRITDFLIKLPEVDSCRGYLAYRSPRGGKIRIGDPTEILSDWVE